MFELKTLKVYQHEFLARLYLNPPTMDESVTVPSGVHRVDYLFVNDAVDLTRKEIALGAEEIEVNFAILTEPETPVAVFRKPYTVYKQKGEKYKKLRTGKEIADAVIGPLVTIDDNNKFNVCQIGNLLDFLEKYR